MSIISRRSVSSITSLGRYITVNKPAGTIQGDVMIAIVASIDPTKTVTPPSGWTLIGRATNIGEIANGFQCNMYYRIAGSSEGTNYTWDMSSDTYTRICVASYINALMTAAVMNVSLKSNQPSSNTLTAPSIITSPNLRDAGWVLMAVISGEGSVTYQPSGTSLLYSQSGGVTTPLLNIVDTNGDVSGFSYNPTPLGVSIYKTYGAMTLFINPANQWYLLNTANDINNSMNNQLR